MPIALGRPFPASAATDAVRPPPIRPGSGSDPLTSAPRALRKVTLGCANLSTHDHLCAFVRGDDERERLALSFFAEGLEAGEACRYVGNLRDGRTMAATMANKGVDVRLFEVSQPWSTLQDGPFDGDRLIDAAYTWSWKMDALDGPHPTRTIADMTAPSSRSGCAGFHARLADYEIRATEHTNAFPHVLVCMFDFGIVGGDIVIESVKSHVDAWMGDHVLARLPRDPGRPVGPATSLLWSGRRYYFSPITIESGPSRGST